MNLMHRYIFIPTERHYLRICRKLQLQQYCTLADKMTEDIATIFRMIELNRILVEYTPLRQHEWQFRCIFFAHCESLLPED